MKNRGLRLLLTLLTGGAGAALAIYAGIPAPALLGSAVFTSAAAIMGAKMFIPVNLRNLGFLAIGCSLGTSLSPQTLSAAAQWPISLLMLSLAVALMMLASGWLLVRFYGISTETAVLATSPGALSYALALSAGGIGDTQAVMVLQSMRLLLVTTVLPFMLEVIDLPSGGEHLTGREAMSAVMVLLTIGLALIAGFGLDRIKMPAAYLIAGMAVSGFSHALGYIEGTMPYALVTCAFVVTGSVIGTRFTGIALPQLRRLALGASLGVVVASSIAAAFALVVAHLLDVPFGQVWVAYAPGGVEAMAAMALALDYDPAFVAVHHVFRIVALIFALPLILRFVGAKRTST